MTKQTVFIVNPAAGCGKAARAFEKLRPVLPTYFPNATVFISERQGHVQELARQTALDGASCLIAVGGDGTFNESVNGLFADKKAVNPDLVLGILPMGTGSDLARSFAIGRNSLEALKTLARGQLEKIDVGYARLRNGKGIAKDHYFLNILSVGIGAEIAFEVNHSSKWAGPLSYFLHTVKGIFKFRPQLATVRSSENVNFYSGSISELAVANGNYYGGGMLIAPGAKLNDGKFQVILIKGMSKPQLLLKLSSVYSGSHIRKDFTIVSECSWLEVESQESIIIESDGESSGALPLRVECLQEALQVIVGNFPSLQV